MQRQQDDRQQQQQEQQWNIAPRTLAELHDAAVYNLHPLPALPTLVRGVQALLKQAKTYEKEGDPETAYILYCRCYKMALDDIPKHPDYGTAGHLVASRLVKVSSEASEQISRLRPLLQQRRQTWENEHNGGCESANTVSSSSSSSTAINIPIHDVRSRSRSPLSASTSKPGPSQRPLPPTTFRFASDSPLTSRSAADSSLAKESRSSKARVERKNSSSGRQYIPIHIGSPSIPHPPFLRAFSSPPFLGSSRPSSSFSPPCSNRGYTQPFTSPPPSYAASPCSSSHPTPSPRGSASQPPPRPQKKLIPVVEIPAPKSHDRTLALPARLHSRYQQQQQQQQQQRQKLQDQDSKPPRPPKIKHAQDSNQGRQQQLLMPVPVHRERQQQQQRQDQQQYLVPPSPATVPFRSPIPSPAYFDQGGKASPSVTSIATTEAGVPLRTLVLPSNLVDLFTAVALPNTDDNIETCGLIMGRLAQNIFLATVLIIPKQSGTSDMCTTESEEEILIVADKEDVITLGWIHTHPQHDCFLSSRDLHTQAGYQQMLPEAIAIVIAPTDPNIPLGVFRLTDPPGLRIITHCKEEGSIFHPHYSNNNNEEEEDELYVDATNAGHVVVSDKLRVKMLDLR